MSRLGSLKITQGMLYSRGPERLTAEQGSDGDARLSARNIPPSGTFFVSGVGQKGRRPVWRAERARGEVLNVCSTEQMQIHERDGRPARNV